MEQIEHKNFWELTEEEQDKVVEEYLDGKWIVELSEDKHSMILVKNR